MDMIRFFIGVVSFVVGFVAGAGVCTMIYIRKLKKLDRR